MAISTVTAVLRRLGLGRGWNRQRPAIVRYEWPKPGDLLHIDVKKLAKFRRVGHRITGERRECSLGTGREFVYVCVDDTSHSRRWLRSSTVLRAFCRAMSWGRLNR